MTFKIEILFESKLSVYLLTYQLINLFKMSMPVVYMNLIKAPHDLPFWRKSLSNLNIAIKYLNLNDFHHAITQALSKCHSITKFEWDEEWKAYKVEYGTRPLEYDNIKIADVIQRKRYVAQLVANKSLNMFPHNQRQMDNEDFPEIPEFPRKWSSFEIRLFWNHQEKCLHVCGQRLSGDRISYFDVWRIFEEHFKQIEIQQKILLEAILEENVAGDIPDEYLREYLVCDVV